MRNVAVKRSGAVRRESAHSPGSVMRRGDGPTFAEGMFDQPEIPVPSDTAPQAPLGFCGLLD